MAVMDHSITSRTVTQHIESVTHHSVPARTIRRRLQQSGLFARRQLLGLPLTQNHRRLRRKWQRYISEVLQPVVLPYLQGFATAIFQQDNITSPAATPDQHWQRVEAAWSPLPRDVSCTLQQWLPWLLILAGTTLRRSL
ncbi:transposable element Tcb1 transposase [Trichonephila clavipes]|nr:transposable element Tcb1 transposase [Trichonephila clavipes]